MSFSHDSMISTTVDYLFQNKYTDIRADIQGYTQPSIITWTDTGQGHIPDITANYKGVYYVIEIETAGSINNDHSLSQWKLFSAFATQHNSAFCIVVPKAVEIKTKETIRLLGLYANVWTIQ